MATTAAHLAPPPRACRSFRSAGRRRRIARASATSRTRAASSTENAAADVAEGSAPGPPPETSDATRATRLVSPSGGVVHLVGVAHVLATDAAADVRALIEHHRPRAVVVELCDERWRSIASSSSSSSSSSFAGCASAVVPRSVAIEGVPSLRDDGKTHLPGASPNDLLLTLRTIRGVVSTPDDVARDVETLRRGGFFSDVRADVSDPDDPGDAAPPLYRAMGGGADAMYELADGVDVTFRATVDDDVRVMADVRFDWAEDALAALGGEATREALEAKMLLHAGDAIARTEEEEDERWEGMKLLAALRDAARDVTRDAFDVATENVAAEDEGDDFGGGVTWVMIGDDDGNEGSKMEKNLKKKKKKKKGMWGAWRDASGAASEAPSRARLYLAASEFSQTILGDAVDAGGAPPGHEAVAAIAAAMEHGVERIVLGDALASETASAVAAAIDERGGAFAGVALAAGTAFDALRVAALTSPEDLNRAVRAAVAGKSAGNGDSDGDAAGGGLASATTPPWLVDALITTRDERLFRAAWREAEGGGGGGDGGGDDDVAFPVFTPTSRPRCLDDEYDALTYYAYDANGGAGAGGGGVVVAVVGAAHFDGVVARWNDAARVRTQE